MTTVFGYSRRSRAVIAGIAVWVACLFVAGAGYTWVALVDNRLALSLVWFGPIVVGFLTAVVVYRRPVFDPFAGEGDGANEDDWPPE